MFRDNPWSYCVRYWNTGDSATDANLTYLESLGTPWPGITVEPFMDKVRGAINVTSMLPEAVRRHFALPSLFIGAMAYDWNAERLQAEADKLCAAIEKGLEAAAADPALTRGGGADLSDRPTSRGEDVLAALAVFKASRGDAEYQALRIASPGGPIGAAIEDLGRARKRQRLSGTLSVEQEILRAIGSIEWHASRYHHERASG
jgi:hypothetical protein